MLVPQLGGSFEGNPRLANTADPGNRDEPTLGDKTDDVLQLVLTTDKRRELHGKVRRERVERTQRRELTINSVNDQLEPPLGLQKFPQPMLAEIAKADLADELRGRVRDQHLATMPDRHQSRCPAERGTEIVPGWLLRLAGVDSNPHPGQTLGGEPDLHVGGNRDRITSASERGREPVTARREHVPVIALDR